MQFSYMDGEYFVFMDMETYDQLHVDRKAVGDAANFLIEGFTATVAQHEGEVLFVELPAAVELVIQHTEPGVQGDRSTGGTKPATPGDRLRDRRPALHHHRREDQGRHPLRRLPRPGEQLTVAARNKARKRAFQILFEADQRGARRPDGPRGLDPALPGPTTGSRRSASTRWSSSRGTRSTRERIDELIAQYAVGWTLDRMPVVDRNILRLGAYELIWVGRDARTPWCSTRRCSSPRSSPRTSRRRSSTACSAGSRT